ncbi:hypothetical protein ABKN59_004634 [Abortiporus biennis]
MCVLTDSELELGAAIMTKTFPWSSRSLIFLYVPEAQGSSLSMRPTGPRNNHSAKPRLGLVISNFKFLVAGGPILSLTAPSLLSL